MIRTFAIVGLGAFFSGLTYSQGATPPPTFEVASVKRNTSGERATGDTKGDRLTMYNMPMRVIVATAYQVPNDRVVGPDWLDTDGFDIVAKLGPVQAGGASRRKGHAGLRTRSRKGGPKLQEAAKDSQVRPTMTELAKSLPHWVTMNYFNFPIIDQLRLKLEQRKAPLDRIVIDHIERVPLAN